MRHRAFYTTGRGSVPRSRPWRYDASGGGGGVAGQGDSEFDGVTYVLERGSTTLRSQ